MTFSKDLTADEAYDAAAEMDFQIADCGVAAAKAIEEGDMEKAIEDLQTILELNRSMKEAAEIGEHKEWVEYANALADHVKETLQAIEDGREWDAFGGAKEIPELSKLYLGRRQ
jgi:DNA polymerase III delta prime subunit